MIHIAGTSGKGSTAYLTSILLRALSFKVGLHVSPHFVDIRERFQINNRLIKKSRFREYINKLLPAIEKMKKTKYGAPTYFEILTAMAYYIFWDEKVDYAVVETGIGGFHDATNTISKTDKFVILTRIGLDHTAILGKTLDKIAFQKAMIIQKNNMTCSIFQRPIIRKVIEKIADQKKAQLFYVNKQSSFFNLKVSMDGTCFDFRFNDFVYKRLFLSLRGFHQTENASVALASIILLSKRDGFNISEEKIRKALVHAHFEGRMEILKIKEKSIIIDGAHNPQKISMLVKNLVHLLPNQKFTFVIAFKNDKDFITMIKWIIPLAHKIIITSFFTDKQDWIHFSQAPENVMNICKKLRFNNCFMVPLSKEAFNEAIKGTNHIVVTGSLYLLSDLYPYIGRLQILNN